MWPTLLLSLIWTCEAVPVWRAEDNVKFTSPPTPMMSTLLSSPRPALQEDVNLLVYGVLQLSQALHDTYHNTERRLQRVNSSLSTYNLTLGMLDRETRQIGLDAEQLKTTIKGLQMEEEAIQRQSSNIFKSFGEVLDSHRALEEQVRKLEQHLSRSSRPAVKNRSSYLSHLKIQTGQQNMTLRTLMDMVKHQQWQMAQQRQQLSQIQEQITNNQEISQL
ncbi:angiopoietin-like protein 8 [Pleurodeles waltl]|uniref:angiopoietin-like protein 8 n=1 Tax=Pleurodeles waltl TaxID=8319 RepID=UPI00370982BA